uniref:Uncharacterized protein n=1 Tax=Salvator merianae TaxID=96440 RepID=A0A8D0BQI1_SALMN
MESRRLAGLGATAALFCLLLSTVAAESVRETETMDPQLYPEEFPSGDLPDDEDSRPDLVIDDYGFSGSGTGEDAEDDLISTSESPVDSIDNYIPESENKKDTEPAVIENEIIIPKKASPSEEEDVSNKISMASTGNGSIFERTEVLAALIAGYIKQVILEVPGTKNDFCLCKLLFAFKANARGFSCSNKCLCHF